MNIAGLQVVINVSSGNTGLVEKTVLVIGGLLLVVGARQVWRIGSPNRAA